MADDLGFSRTDATFIATAISEIVRNIIDHADKGEVILGPIREDDREGLIVIARDEGPGIANVELAMRDQSPSRVGLGMGLPGAKRLMDDFEIVSEVGKGTTVTMKKWRGYERMANVRAGRPGARRGK